MHSKAFEDAQLELSQQVADFDGLKKLFIIKAFLLDVTL